MGRKPAEHPLVTALSEPVRVDRGTVEIVRGGEVLATLEAGSFFGELGAQDAGPGYAMARNATVRAMTAVELGVLDEEAFTAVFRSVPEFRDAIHATSDRQG